MKDLGLSAPELARTARAARMDVPDIASLKKIASPASGDSFMVQKALFVWAPDDKTSDDGASSVRPEGTPESAAGRFRRVTLAFRNSSKV